MNISKKVEVQKRRIEFLEAQLSRKDELIRRLKADNEAYKSQIDNMQELKGIYEGNIAEINQLKSQYKEAIYNANEMKKKYQDRFKQQLDRIKRQK